MTTAESLYLLENPVYQGAGETRARTIVCSWATAVDSVSSITAYKNGEDVSATVFPSGSISTSGNTFTTKPLTALTGGETYILSMIFVADGVTRQRFLEVRAVKSTTGKWQG